MWNLALDFHLSFTQLHFCTLPERNAIQDLSFINMILSDNVDVLPPVCKR